MLMSPANRFHMPPPSMKSAMPGADPVDQVCTDAGLMEELDGMVNTMVNATNGEHADCTTADHHAVPMDAVEDSERPSSDMPQGLLLRPQPRRSEDVDAEESTGIRRRVSWSDPVPLWSVDHLTGVAQAGAMSPRGRRASLERMVQGGRASLELEYNTSPDWEVPTGQRSSSLNRSSA